MTIDAKQTINEILDYFQNGDEEPGGDWAFDDDFASLGLDYRSPARETIFWLDIERDGTIVITWRTGGRETKSLTFVHQQQARERNMTELSKSEKLRLARIFANASGENIVLKAALKKLVFAARTSGGTAGRDDALCAACDEAEALLIEPVSP